MRSAFAAAADRAADRRHARSINAPQCELQRRGCAAALRNPPRRRRRDRAPGCAERSGIRYHTHPAGGLPLWVRQDVIGGPGAFRRIGGRFETFAGAIAGKLLAEIAGLPMR